MKPRLGPTLICACLVSLPALAGCATTVAPDRVAAPKAMIAAAEEAGAAENPDASLQLKLARDEFDHAKRLIRRGDGERAVRVLDRAAADAELALELARLQRTRQAANDALERIEALKKEHHLIKSE